MPIDKPNKPLRIEVLKRQTLLDTELLIERISNTRLSSVEVWLATDLAPHLFRDSLIASLFAFARRLGKHITVIDWVAAPSDVHLKDRFGTSIEGLACLEFANEIADSQKHELRSRVQHLRFQAIEKNGIRTPETTGGKSLTFCAFDPELPTPIGFVGIQGKASFIRTLLGVRKDFFEIGLGERFSDKVSQTADHAVAGFVYELWQNGIQHGRFDADHQAIRGMRYLRLRKHVGGKFEGQRFLNRAAGFPELQSYLGRAVRNSQHYKFYEVAIADSGIGIVERFLATRPEFRRYITRPNDHSALINRIVKESLSSKLNQAGAGHGLEQALRAVGALKGFLSLRTGRSWLYHDASKRPNGAADLTLRAVQHDYDLASLGTQINLVYPLMEPGE